MEIWDVKSLDVEPHHPQVLQSDDEGRTIVINLPAGEELQEHQVHERAWIVVVDGEVEIEDADGKTDQVPARDAGADGRRTSATRCGRLDDSRLVLVLAPWPGEGHPSQRGDGAERARAESAAARARRPLRHPRQPAGARGGARRRARGRRARVRARRRLRAVRRVPGRDASHACGSSTPSWIRGNTDRWLDDPRDAPGRPEFERCDCATAASSSGERSPPSSPGCRDARRSPARCSATPRRARTWRRSCPTPQPGEEELLARTTRTT